MNRRIEEIAEKISEICMAAYVGIGVAIMIFMYLAGIDINTACNMYLEIFISKWLIVLWAYPIIYWVGRYIFSRSCNL